MSSSALDPQQLALSVAQETAENADLVGDFVEANDLGGNVTDFRFDSDKRGYEGWQWSVTLFHDEERDTWTVDESALMPTDRSLLAPAWVAWKDRLKPEDLAVTDALGTEADDPRLEGGFRSTDVSGADTDAVDTADKVSAEHATTPENTTNGDMQAGDAATAADRQDAGAQPDAKDPDVAQAVSDLRLSRRHVLTPIGRAEAAQRWYQGQHGPKSLSTTVAEGNTCSTCGFFIPIRGDLGVMFGVCANKWSPDDGRVVSTDHGCGEHSEIDPPEVSHLWVQSEPALDDMHIDVIAQKPREEPGQVEIIEQMGADEADTDGGADVVA